VALRREGAPGQKPTRGWVRTLAGPAVSANDAVQANALPYGEECDAFGDDGYQGARKRPDATDDVDWHIARRPGKRRAPGKTKSVHVLIHALEYPRPSAREGRPSVPRRRVPVWSCEVALPQAEEGLDSAGGGVCANQWLARRVLLVLDGQVRPKAANAA